MTDPPGRADRVVVPAGAFTYGNPEAELDRVVALCREHASNPETCESERFREHHRNETPQVEIVLEAFAIDRLEVTNADYASCVRDGGCEPVDVGACTFFGEEGPVSGGTLDAARLAPDSPIVCVGWAQAAAYCAAQGARLPTEAEWEKAARGTDARRFPWGDEWRPDVANWNDDGAADGHVTTAPAGSYPGGASPYGALDMAGNVWEWVGEAHPTGSVPDGERVMRGGGYAANPIALRTTKRVARMPGGWENVGFRCAL